MGNSKEFNQQESDDSVGTDPNGTIHNEDLDSDEVVTLMMLLGSYNPKKRRFSLCMDKFSQTSCKIKRSPL